MSGLLLDISIPKVSFPWEIFPCDESNSSSSVEKKSVIDIKGEQRDFYYIYGNYINPTTKRKTAEYRYFTLKEEKPSDGIEDLSRDANEKISNIRIHKHDGSYSLKLQFYGRKPRYFGALNGNEIYNENYSDKYKGIFEDDDKAVEEPYIENYNTLTLEGLFILLVKLVEKFKIGPDVLFQDFHNEHFEALSGAELPRTVINYIFSKSMIYNNKNNNNSCPSTGFR